MIVWAKLETTREHLVKHKRLHLMAIKTNPKGFEKLYPRPSFLLTNCPSHKPKLSSYARVRCKNSLLMSSGTQLQVHEFNWWTLIRTKSTIKVITAEESNKMFMLLDLSRKLHCASTSKYFLTFAERKMICCNRKTFSFRVLTAKNFARVHNKNCNFPLRLQKSLKLVTRFFVHC